jgi:beta-galactosidase
MASVTYDGRSFMLDGRRIWLVSGSVQYARIPREQWAQRIHAAKMAGLNTIETPVFWNRHEPRAGQFDFKGDNDLRHFLQLVGQAGMWCILRPGPFIGAEWDFGGLPSWLTSVKGIRFRVNNGPFLEACSRYLGAVADQVRDLQVTSRGKPGPLLLVQSESFWTCGDDQQAASYLGELNRYLRESGLEVPTINANNLWQGIEGEIDCWTGGGDMLGIVRQLATVRPDQPRLVIEYCTGAPSTWGVPAPAPPAPAALEQRLAQILAAGGQFNIAPFHGGTTFGFWAGRLPDAEWGYTTASHDHGAPLTETGAPSPAYAGVRRLCTFASRFGRILASLDPAYRPVVMSPALPEAGTTDSTARSRPKREAPPVHSASVIHALGAQGGVAFIFNPEPQRPGPDIVRLLLPDGTSLPADISGQAVTWCIFDASIGGRARIDYSSLSAFGMVGRVVVLFGSAESEGHVSVNGSPLVTTVPARAKTPAIVEHEGLTLVIAAREHLDAVHITDDAVYIGASDVSAAGQPLGTGHRTCTKVSAEGQVSQAPLSAPLHARKGPDRVTFSEWSVAPVTEYCDGTSPRYASIDGPADLGALGSPFGYGWYRVRLKASAPAKTRLALPFSADRLHLHLDGEPIALIGRGPGAEAETTLALKKGTQTLAILAENLGRLSGGNNLGDPKGVYGPIYEVKPIRLPRAILKGAEPLPILSFRTPIWEVNPGDLALPDRITWTLAHRRKTPVIFTVGPSPARALLVLNAKPIALLERGVTERYVLQPEQLKAGVNTVQLAIIPDHGISDARAVLDAVGPGATFQECVQDLGAKADWAFAKWEPPRASAFHKTRPAERTGLHCPAWWAATFEATDPARALFFDATGLTKGQIYINGRHLGRYFTATADGKPVPPQSLYYVPAPWLHAESENTILLFDEHGASPMKSRLVYDAPGPFGP